MVTQLPPITVTPDEAPPLPTNGGVPIPVSRPINVDTNNVEPQPVFSVDENTDDTPAPITPEMAQTRAAKFKYGLGDILKKSHDEIYQGLLNGEEPNFRETAAATIDQRKQEQTQKILSQIVGNKGGPLTPEEIDGIQQIVQHMNQKTDPNSVLEEAYGKQFMATLDRVAQGNPDNFYNDAKKAAPELLAQQQDDLAKHISKREFAETLQHNIEAEAKQQGWAPWLADQAKSMVPGYEDVKTRGLAPDVGVLDGIGLGHNLLEQRKALYRLPFEEFKTKLTEIATKLRADNPTLAAEFVKSMAGMSDDDVLVKDALLPTSLIGTGIGAKFSKGFGKLTGILKDTEHAAVDVARAAADPNISKSGIEAAAGDLKEAAVTRATTDAVAAAKGTPRATEKAVEALFSVVRSDQQAVRANPGRFGQEIVNRLDENTETTLSSLTNAVQTISRVERLPEVLANETAVRAILENIKNNYVGLKNSILDISKPYREKVSNTYLVDMNLGKNDGTYFEQRSVAENFVKFHKLTDAEVHEAVDPQFSKAQVQMSKLNRNITAAEKARTKWATELETATGDAKIEARQQYDFFDKAISDYRTKRANLILDNSGVFQKTTVEQQGLGFYVKVTKPIDETSPVVRSFIAQTANTKMPKNSISEFLDGITGGRASKYRTAEEILSKAERQNRLVATYTPSRLFDIIKANAKSIDQIQSRFGVGSKKWKEFQRVLETAQDIRDPDSADKVAGYFFKDPVELDAHYQQYIGRLPDIDEVQAYFAFKRGMEMDRVFRNMAMHRIQQRAGAETHKIITKDALGNAVESREFSGFARSKLSSADDNVLIMGDKAGEERVRSLQTMSRAEKKDFQEEMDKGGRKLIEIAGPEKRELNGFSTVENQRIRYVLAKDSSVRELDWNHIPRRGGGHVEYDYDWYIKQAKMFHDENGPVWYEGDTTIMPIQLQSMGKAVAGHLDQVRQLLKAKEDDAARDYSNANLHIDWQTVSDWFKAKKDADGRVQLPQLNLNEKIQVVPKNKQIVNIDNDLARKYAHFKDGTREGSFDRQAVVQFAGERDAEHMFTLEDVGTRHNPLYQIAQADKIDPITSMNRGLSRIAHSNFMDDYKTMSVEHWLAQAKQYLDATESEIAHSPFYHYNNPKFLSGTPPEIRAQLEANKYHADQLMGVPSFSDALLHSTAQKIVDYTYDKFGPKGVIIEPGWLLPKLKDPFAFIRSVVHNVKMGLGNIPQFIVQMGNYSNILGIAGYKYAAPGTYAAQLHFWSTVNSHPAIIDHLDMWATKLSLPGTSKWKLGEFKEALQEFHNTGFGSVGGEYATLDNPTSGKVIENMGQKFLDWGAYPFKKGEQNARYGAWYTAYREFRDAHPVGRITEEDRAAILQRADLLNANMSRASSSAMTKGILSIPTQFYTYQLRLMEMFYGTRLTGVERARMFATNAVLYGVPMATGLTGLPVADWLRKQAMQMGYVLGDNYFTSLLDQGLPSALGSIVSGDPKQNYDSKSGTFFDVGNRFGTKGFEFIGGMNRHDKGFMDIVGGAAWSVGKGTWEQMDGFFHAMGSMINNGGKLFPPTVEDVVDVFKQIPIVNATARIAAAWNSARWISTNEAYLGDTTVAKTVFAALVGLKDQKLNDMQTKLSSIADQKDMEKEVEKQFMQEFRRGVLLQKDDPEQARKFFTRATTLLSVHYPEDKKNTLLSRAVEDNKSLIDKVDWQFYTQGPEDQKETRMKAYRKLLQLKDKRGEK